jgi:hypothetical protein
MTRFETTIVALTTFGIAALYSPVFGQDVKFDFGKGSEGKAKDVVAETKGDPKAGPNRKNKNASPEASRPPAQPKEPTFMATGGFESTKDKARDSAIRAAVEELHKRLVNDHGINRMPTTEMVRKLLLNDQEKVTEEPIVSESGKTETMYRITVAVRIEDHHIRELRSRDRSSEALWILAGLGGLAGALALFFRVDSWTKGYLTSWLALGTIGATALMAGLWWWAK